VQLINNFSTIIANRSKGRDAKLKGLNGKQEFRRWQPVTEREVFLLHSEHLTFDVTKNFRKGGAWTGTIPEYRVDRYIFPGNPERQLVETENQTKDFKMVRIIFNRLRDLALVESGPEACLRLRIIITNAYMYYVY
jgi:heme-degrading monooxygenase HmoA